MLLVKHLRICSVLLSQWQLQPPMSSWYLPGRCARRIHLKNCLRTLSTLERYQPEYGFSEPEGSPDFDKRSGINRGIYR